MGAGCLKPAADPLGALTDALERALAAAALAPDTPLVVALSGGRDSAALLATALRGGHPLRAIHVNHGLGAHALPLQSAAEALCRQLDVALTLCHVEVTPAERARLGLEGAARVVRRRALIAATDPGEVLLTAHHADDQLETVLLKLLRGDGPLAGLGIRPDTRAGGRRWLRPLLALPHQVLADAAAQQALIWAEDPSNSDPALDRNWLRHAILPALLARRPALRQTVATGASRSAALLDWIEAEVRRALARCQGLDPATLSLEALAAEPAVLHAPIWTALCRSNRLPPPRRADREALAAQLPGRPDAAVCLRWPGAELRLWAGLAWLMPPLAPLPVDWVGRFDAAGRLDLPDGGRLQADQPAARRDQTVRYPRTGDRLRLDDRRVRYTELCQRERVPPWLRPRIPLLVAADGTLVAALGIAHDPQDLTRRGRVRCRPGHHAVTDLTNDEARCP